jgi:predicted ATPase
VAGNNDQGQARRAKSGFGIPPMTSTMTRPTIETVRIKGFRSIKEMELDLRPLNVLVGANGAGKSNLVSFFKLINEIMGRRLQKYVAETGRATANLHFGPKVTPQMEGSLRFAVDGGTDTYKMRLFHAAGDALVFAEEVVSFHQHGYQSPKENSLGTGHQETSIFDAALEGDPTAKTLRFLLNRCRVFHFHDTSPTARVRQFCNVTDDRWLMPDAANLAAVLYRLLEHNEKAYRRIVATIRQIAPFFDDFRLEPTSNRDIILNWRHRESDLTFGPHQLSDGTLRAICLVVLLMQPSGELPHLIVVDEPELGLHPYALNVVASLFRVASGHAQVLISTQSPAFLDQFGPEDIVIVDRDDEASTFARPDASKLTEWLADYSLGEVWEKNIFGGGPH